jgi:hypothetical protein
LATILERRIKKASEGWLDDSQNGFREKRSTSHSIHVLRRVQEACRSANLRAYAVFIDFEKAFDSPPRGALYECLDWIGVPPDVLSVVKAIHEDPKGKVRGSSVWFRVGRGVRQGCVLGPTMFIILLEFCMRMADLKDLGVELVCVDKKALDSPLDLKGVTFRVGIGGYCDDYVLIHTNAAALNEALGRIQSICGSIGLNISVSKTEWLYLNNPVKAELESCAARRTPLVHCCEQIFLNGCPLRHKSTFRYLGSIVSENGGVEEDTRFRVMQAQLSLSRYNGIWKSDLKLRQKVRFLKTHVFPSLLYGVECGGHTQRDLAMFSVFLNMCRRRILGVSRRAAADGAAITNAELQRRCRLPEPLDLISCRRLMFVTKLVTRASCETARRVLFAEVAPQAGVRRISGRERSSYLNVLALDLRYLYSGGTARKSLEGLIALARERGAPEAKRTLKALKPDTARGGSLKLVAARERNLICHVNGCRANFAEQKEVNRHVRNSHPTEAAALLLMRGRQAGSSSRVTGGERRRPPAASAVSTSSERTANSEAGSLSCPVPGC